MTQNEAEVRDQASADDVRMGDLQDLGYWGIFPSP